MKTQQGRATRLIAALSLGVLAVTAGAQTWTFDGDQQGWIARDIVSYSDLGDSSELMWSDSGGASGGYVSKFDPSMNTFAFAAPITAGTNYSAYLGGNLTFSLQSDFNDWTADSVVILRGLDGANLTTIVSAIPVPGASWTDYSIGLTGSNFRIGNQSGAVVSDAQFASIMGNLSTFMISGEYGNGVKETTGLDNVAFIPEPSTTAALLGGAVLLVAGIARRRSKR